MNNHKQNRTWLFYKSLKFEIERQIRCNKLLIKLHTDIHDELKGKYLIKVCIQNSETHQRKRGDKRANLIQV